MENETKMNTFLEDKNAKIIKNAIISRIVTNKLRNQQLAH